MEKFPTKTEVISTEAEYNVWTISISRVLPGTGGIQIWVNAFTAIKTYTDHQLTTGLEGDTGQPASRVPPREQARTPKDTTRLLKHRGRAAMRRGWRGGLVHVCDEDNMTTAWRLKKADSPSRAT